MKSITIIIMLYTISSATSHKLLINDSYVCFLDIDELEQSIETCEELDSSSSEELAEGYNMTHVWFIIDERKCTALSGTVYEIGDCGPQTQTSFDVPANCGKDSKGQPVKCSERYN